MRMKGKIGIYIIVFIVFVICFFGAYSVISQFMSKLFNANDKTRIESKEEMFQFVLDNREKLEEIVLDMEELYDEKKEHIIVIRRSPHAGYKLETADELIEKHKLSYISVKMEKESYEVTFSFESAPRGYTYWGIYHTENGEPTTWGEGSLVENDGLYKQEGSYFIYETEQIIDNWYYYQCNAG